MKNTLAVILASLAGMALLGAQSAPAPEAPAAETPKAPKPESFVALLLNSPFKPVLKNKISVRNVPAALLQFRGMLTIAGETEFGLYDTRAQRCYWLKLREQNENGIVVESYNPTQKSLNVQTATGRLVLTLANPEEKPLAVKAAYNPHQGVTTGSAVQVVQRGNANPQNNNQNASGQQGRRPQNAQQQGQGGQNNNQRRRPQRGSR